MDKYIPFAQSFDCDNESLIKLYNRAKENVDAFKEGFDKLSEKQYENNYIKFHTIRLAYNFAKEEKNALYGELLKRGLITNNYFGKS